jgi:alanyl-tRNA synthetase
VTRRLYQDDSYATEFESRVVGVRPAGKCWEIALEATLFYPESGGQPCDVGWIDSARIDAVRESDDEIVHIASAEPALKPGQTVKGKIDWPARFLNMQQHTGQHILSQAFLRVLGARTVSSRLGIEHSTIDVSSPALTWEEVERVERAANAIVYENRPVKIYEARPGEIKGMRAKKEPVGEILRIVEVSDFDISPCGGTHTRSTGEVGLVKMLRWEKVRDTTRVEFLCGRLAEDDYFWKSRAVVELAQDFTARDRDLPALVRELDATARDLRKEIAKIKAKLAGFEADDLESRAEVVQGARVVHAIFEDKGPAELREMAARLTSRPGRVALLASRGEQVHFVFARSADLGADMRLALGAATAIADGRGGGRPEVAQGGGKKPEQAEEALAEARKAVANLLSGIA